MAQGYLLTAAFTGCVAITALFLPRRARYVWLLVCSLAYYGWALLGLPIAWPPQGGQTLIGTVLPALGLLVATGLLGWGLALGQHYARRGPLRGLCFAFGLVLPLGLWAGCRYLGLFAGVGAPAGFVLPLGLAFYSLQAAGYALDVFARRTEAEKNPLRCLAFFCFFPTLTFGPVQRAGGLLPQLRLPERFDYNRFFGGLFRMLWGVFKKMVVADNLAVLTGFAMAEPTVQPAPVLALCIPLFALQLYCELSAFADLAVGAGGMLGFELYENFPWPFGAADSAGLWGRWMASVTGLFRDAVMLPLNALKRRAAPLRRPWPARVVAAAGGFLAFVLFGLWVDATGTFLPWAAATGGLIAISCATRPLRDGVARRVPLYRARPVRGLIRRLLTWVFFLGSALLLMDAFFGRAPGEWWWRLAVGWENLNLEFLLGRVARAGLEQNRLWAALGGAGAVLLCEGWASAASGTMGSWVRRRLFFLRWPLYFLILLALLFFGVFPGQLPLLAGL